MDSDVEVRVILPGNIQIQQHNFEVLFLDAFILLFATVQEIVIDLINEQIRLRML